MLSERRVIVYIPQESIISNLLKLIIAFMATPSIRGNPTAEHAGGNACVVSSQDNVENPRTQLGSTARIRTLGRV
jgi:hypothetical protein